MARRCCVLLTSVNVKANTGAHRLSRRPENPHGVDTRINDASGGGVASKDLSCRSRRQARPTSLANWAYARQRVVVAGTILEQGGPPALTKIAKGRGRKRSISEEKIDAVVDATLRTTPAGKTHWSLRSIAKAQGTQP